jgi:hypothetical protein
MALQVEVSQFSYLIGFFLLLIKAVINIIEKLPLLAPLYMLNYIRARGGDYIFAA